VAFVVVALKSPMLEILAAADKKLSEEANVATNWAVVLETFA
jgi:hypothetical protein